MKEIGDKLRRCANGTCFFSNVNDAAKQVLDGQHVAVMVIRLIHLCKSLF